MTQTLNIALIMGGPSLEADVSRSSAAEVATALRQRHHQVEVYELDSHLAGNIATQQPQLVFPVLHGPPGEDGTLQGFLEILSLPYVGSGVRASAVAMDKTIAKSVYRAQHLPVAQDQHVDFARSQDWVQVANDISERFGSAVVVKPNAQGSALGVERVRDPDQLHTVLQTAAAARSEVLIEPFIEGREITVGVLDEAGSQPMVFPVIEVRTADGQWYDFNNRYAPGQSEHIVDPDLPSAILDELQSVALRAHRALGLVDLSRSDFIVTANNEIYLLETNTLPGMTPTSLYPDGARAAGIHFDELVERLARSGCARGTRLQVI